MCYNFLFCIVITKLRTLALTDNGVCFSTGSETLQWKLGERNLLPTLEWIKIGSIEKVIV